MFLFVESMAILLEVKHCEFVPVQCSPSKIIEIKHQLRWLGRTLLVPLSSEGSWRPG